jgi:antitoxin component of MazEF toxin-antitoxin module
MARVLRVGHSLFALIPAHAAKQLSLVASTEIKCLVESDSIRFCRAIPLVRVGEPVSAGKAPAIQEPEEKW